jgi:hypothetical protein
MTPVDTLGEPVTVVDTLGEPVVLINNDGTPAFLAYSAKTYLGGVAPYHWLDFINNRALYAGADVGNVTQATGYSFTRASDGYYTNSDGTLTLFGSGALRRGDRGVLIEGSRTNLCLRSEEFDNAAWTKTDITVTANNTSAPDGATTADLLTEGSAGTASLAKSSAITVVSGSTYTTTVFIKRSAVVQWVRFIAADTGGIGNGVQGWFDVQNGALGTFSTRGTGWTAVSRAITAFANGWYRLTLVYTTGAVTQNILLNSTSADNNATRVAGSAYWLWGFQDELGAFPSSPIITVAASATRAADVLSYTVNTTAQINAAVAAQPELVTNGGFATDSDWTKGAGWTISAGKAQNSGSIGGLTQTILTIGKTYACTFTIDAVSNWLVGPNSISYTTPGTYTIVFTATGTALRFDTQVGGHTATIDNISVKEVPANSLTLYPLQLWSEFERAVDTGGFEDLFNLDDGDSSDRAVLYVGTTDLASVDMRTASVSQGPATVAGTVALNTVTKLAGRFQTNDMRPARGGTLGTADTSCTLPAAPTRLVIGNAPSFGYIRRIAAVQGAGTDADLQAMTS